MDRHVENPGSEDYLYRIKNPGTGREEMVRLGKYLEWLLLVAFDKAHGGRKRLSPNHILLCALIWALFT